MKILMIIFLSLSATQVFGSLERLKNNNNLRVRVCTNLLMSGSTHLGQSDHIEPLRSSLSSVQRLLNLYNNNRSLPVYWHHSDLHYKLIHWGSDLKTDLESSEAQLESLIEDLDSSDIANKKMIFSRTYKGTDEIQNLINDGFRSADEQYLLFVNENEQYFRNTRMRLTTGALDASLTVAPIFLGAVSGEPMSAVFGALFAGVYYKVRTFYNKALDVRGFSKQFELVEQALRQETPQIPRRPTLSIGSDVFLISNEHLHALKLIASGDRATVRDESLIGYLQEGSRPEIENYFFQDDIESTDNVNYRGKYSVVRLSYIFNSDVNGEPVWQFFLDLQEGFKIGTGRPKKRTNEELEMQGELIPIPVRIRR